MTTTTTSTTTWPYSKHDGIHPADWDSPFEVPDGRSFEARLAEERALGLTTEFFYDKYRARSALIAQWLEEQLLRLRAKARTQRCRLTHKFPMKHFRDNKPQLLAAARAAGLVPPRKSDFVRLTDFAGPRVEVRALPAALAHP